ncbi:hypothetical protein RDV77_03240 [Porphyromonadaceae sp. NP-X]|jgi:hypothetical protein|nr:hypothetical protein [Porphyromonadaceae sp. NP-X]
MIGKIIKKLLLVYYSAYLAGIIAAVLGYILIFKNFGGIESQSAVGINLSSALILFIILSLPLSLGLFHFQIKKWLLIPDERVRIKKYENASICRIVVLGLGFVTGILFAYLLRSQSMIFCAAIAAAGLIFCKPSEKKMIQELQLDDEEENNPFQE